MGGGGDAYWCPMFGGRMKSSPPSLFPGGGAVTTGGRVEDDGDGDSEGVATDCSGASTSSVDGDGASASCVDGDGASTSSVDGDGASTCSFDGTGDRSGWGIGVGA
uniref:Uncharacterized protein n=1 Tax=Noccaea caerulescens TaxID=107243 RepID=A0A1J3I6N3_NOCCA